MIHARKFLSRLVLLAAISSSSVTLAQEQPPAKGSPGWVPDATLFIDSAGHTFIAGSKVDEAEMTNHFRELAESTSDPRVRIECDRGITTGRVKAIVKILADAGVTNLAFATTGNSPPKPAEPAPKLPLPVIKVAIPQGSKLSARDILRAAAILARENTVQVTYPSAGKRPVTLYDPELLREWDPSTVQLSADGYIVNGEKLVAAKVLQEKLKMISETATLVGSTPSIYLVAADQVPAARLYEAFDIILATGVHAHPAQVHGTSRPKRKRTIEKRP